MNRMTDLFAHVRRGLAALSCSAALAMSVPHAAEAQTDQIARGAYLAKAADCVACHTAPGGTAFAGGRAFPLPIGTLYSPNITPDPKTGIGGYSDEAWLKMLHSGVAQDGKHLYPAMPYDSYTLMSDEDALAIKAYLFSVKPVVAVHPDNEIRFPYSMRWTMVFWNLFNNPNRRFSPDQTKSAIYNRGDYLVNALGHCGECHTPRNFMMGLSSAALADTVQADWRAYNLTNDPKSGLGRWTDDQLTQYLSTGQAPGRGPASGPMAEAVENSLSKLEPSDIKAMAVYLRGVPPQGETSSEAEPAGAPADDALGQRLFVQACAGCHLPNGSGRQSAWAALAGAHTTADPAATNLVQVLTKGSQLQTPQGLMFMHAFTGAYTDAELAAIGNYVQRQFGGLRGTVTPEQIGRNRTIPAPAIGPKPSS